MHVEPQTITKTIVCVTCDTESQAEEFAQWFVDTMDDPDLAFGERADCSVWIEVETDSEFQACADVAVLVDQFQKRDR